MKVTYDETFYKEMQDTNLASARVVVPIVLSLVGKVSSVVDVGCGRGLWLKAFQENGVTDIFGVDGAWNTPETLVIPKEAFGVRDFEKPFSIGRTADLAISLEVAEHVSPAHADDFVAALVATAPVVVFSAAIPGQGGTDHRNEQWPRYWIEKFEAKGYAALDMLRKRVWDHPDVSFFYAQNMLVFVKKETLAHYPLLQAEFATLSAPVMHLVHPKLLEYEGADAARWKLVAPYFGMLPTGLLRWGKSVLRRIRGKNK